MVAGGIDPERVSVDRVVVKVLRELVVESPVTEPLREKILMANALAVIVTAVLRVLVVGIPVLRPLAVKFLVLKVPVARIAKVFAVKRSAVKALRVTVPGNVSDLHFPQARKSL